MAIQSPFDFIFEPPAATNMSQLAQGDLLRRTPALAEAIKVAHAYYASAEDYSHFLILTQSCDLIRRQNGCKSRYITVCAVRPLEVAVDRELRRFSSSVDGFPFPVGDLSRGNLARQYLERVMNNTVDGMFFIPKGSVATVDEHLCAFLPLSIALRVDHYDTCLSAKVGQVREIFAAKIGSLASGIYGRVATPDLSEKHPEAVAVFKKEFFEELGYERIAWLSEVQKKALKKKIKETVDLESAAVLSEERAEKMLKDLPNEATEFVDQALKILVKRAIIDDDETKIAIARSFLLNDPTIKKLARQ